MGERTRDGAEAKKLGEKNRSEGRPLQRLRETGWGEKATTTGRVMLWVGAAVLLGEVWTLLTQLSEFWQGSGAAALGWMAALGAAAQKAVSFVVWNDGLLLAVAAKVLVLCCPLLVIAAGIGLIRKAELAQARKFAAKSTQAEEERP